MKLPRKHDPLGAHLRHQNVKPRRSLHHAGAGAELEIDNMLAQVWSAAPRELCPRGQRITRGCRAVWAVVQTPEGNRMAFVILTPDGLVISHRMWS